MTELCLQSSNELIFISNHLLPVFTNRPILDLCFAPNGAKGIFLYIIIYKGFAPTEQALRLHLTSKCGNKETFLDMHAIIYSP